MRYSKILFLSIFLKLCSSLKIDLDHMVTEMDLSEKCGQMTQLSMKYFLRTDISGKNILPINVTLLKEIISNYKIGSLLTVPDNNALESKKWRRIINLIQKYAIKNTRFKIPIIYGLDSIHGANYIQEAVLFPHSLNIAATFNLNIAEKVGEITSIETRAVGIAWNFNPTLDIGKHPVWSRYLNS